MIWKHTLAIGLMLIALLTLQAHGAIGEGTFDRKFLADKGVKVLNNLVFELLNAPSPGSKAFTVYNPRDGWLFVSLKTMGRRTAAPTVRIDSAEYRLRPVGDAFETMRFIPQGSHKVQIGKGVKASHIVVRSIGELAYCMYGADPYLRDLGLYDWAFFRKYAADNYNIIVGTNNPTAQEAEIREWTSEGKWWTTLGVLPQEMKSGEDAYRYWAGLPGMTHPLMKGIWVDEFLWYDSYKDKYPLWLDGIRRLAADPKLKGRILFGYMGDTMQDQLIPFYKTMMECGYRLAPEWYMEEMPSEGKIMGYFGPEWERNNRAKYAAVDPAAPNNRLMVLGTMSAPPERCDVYPNADYNVYLDMQFHFLATEPGYFGLRGIQGYYTPYIAEEQVRLLSRLIRHYAIEGRTDRMLKDPYELNHIQNPDFDTGTEGWTLSPASEESITPDTVEGFSRLQSRYHWVQGMGVHILRMRRSADKPNTFSQEIRNLQPGRLYSLRFFSGNYEDFTAGRERDCQHGISVRLDNVTLMADKCLQVRFRGINTFGPFNANHPYWMNYWQRVFRAKGDARPTEHL